MGSVKLLKMQRHKELTRASGSGAAPGSCRAPAQLLPHSCPRLLSRILPSSCPAPIPASGNSVYPLRALRPNRMKVRELWALLWLHPQCLPTPGQAGAGEEGAIRAVAPGSAPGRPE